MVAVKINQRHLRVVVISEPIQEPVSRHEKVSELESLNEIEAGFGSNTIELIADKIPLAERIRC